MGSAARRPIPPWGMGEAWAGAAPAGNSVLGAPPAEAAVASSTGQPPPAGTTVGRWVATVASGPACAVRAVKSTAAGSPSCEAIPEASEAAAPEATLKAPEDGSPAAVAGPTPPGAEITSPGAGTTAFGAGTA